MKKFITQKVTRTTDSIDVWLLVLIFTRMAAMIFFAAVLTAVSPKVHAVEKEFKWQHFGAAPYATSRDEAIRTRESAFTKLGFPKPVVALLMEATKQPGEKIRLTNGNRLTAMMSKGGVVHRNVLVSFNKPPVSGKMEYAAPAEKWQVSWHGEAYTVFLPEICNNWSAIEPSRLPSKCVELTFNAPVGGKVRWGIGTTTGPLPPDVCNAQKQDDGPWTAWYGECDYCIPAIGYIRGVLGDSAQIPHKYLYPVTHTKQTLRFSTEIWTDVVYICLEDASGRQTCGVYMRPQDWKKQYHVDILDELWQYVGKCPS